jgi:hypothetical protein
MTGKTISERLREGTLGSDVSKTDAFLNGTMSNAAALLDECERVLMDIEDAREAHTDGYARQVLASHARAASEALTKLRERQ